MATTDAQRRAKDKWQKEKIDDIRLRVPKGKKAEIQAFAKQQGKSINSFINEAINAAMKASE